MSEFWYLADKSTPISVQMCKHNVDENEMLQVQFC